MQGKYRLALEEIADHYGFINQREQLYEEMGELIVSLNKLRRSTEDRNNIADCPYINVVYENVVTELADVEIMIEQIKYLLDCEGDVDSEKIRKINRQLHIVNKSKMEETREKKGGMTYQ